MSEFISIFQIQDTDEVRHQFAKGVSMPFNVNNVDITVAANFIYTVTMVAVANVVEDPVKLIDADIEVCSTLLNYIL